MKKVFYTLLPFLISQILISQTHFYGTSLRGGVYDNGTIFKTDSNGNNPAIIYDFKSNNNYSSSNKMHLSIVNSEVYGIALGGEYEVAGIYKVNSVLNKIEKVFDFDLNYVDPTGQLILANDGLYYGITEWGGGLSGEGNLYSLNPLTNSLSTVYNFSGSFNGATPNAMTYHNNKF